MEENRFYFPHKILPYLLTVPQLIIVFIFILYPTFESFRLSLFMADPFGRVDIFVGLENYIDLFTSAEFFQSLRATFIFSFSVTFIGMAGGLVISILLNQKIKGLGIFRTGMILPYALSPAVVGALWMFLFHPSYGILTYVTPIRLQYLTNRRHAMILLVLAAAWRFLGFNIAFYLAGLQNIPQSYLEAASIDGAGSFQRFRKVIFPLLTPTTFFLLTMNLVYSFYRIFGLIHTVTKGGPGGSTNVLVFKAYRDGVTHLMPGFSAAQSVILFFIAVSLVFLQFKYVQRGVHYE